jgi:hypothetical protein
MTHKVIGGSLQLAVPPRCLPDVGVGLAHPVGLISSLSAISTRLITVLPRGDSSQADADCSRLPLTENNRVTMLAEQVDGVIGVDAYRDILAAAATRLARRPAAEVRPAGLQGSARR